MGEDLTEGEMEPEDFIKGLIDLTGHPIISFIAAPVAERIRRTRLEAGVQALRERMATGAPWAFREHEAASLIFDFLRAAEDGTAKRNLEIMADLIANGLGEQGLAEEAIRHLMKTIASLSYDELRVLAAFVRAVRGLSPLGDGAPSDAFQRTSEIWEAVWKDLAQPGDTAPSMEVFARAGALQRTGLLVAHSAFGGIVYGPGPALLDIERLSDVVDLMARTDKLRR